jgi:hypothetical protein
MSDKTKTEAGFTRAYPSEKSIAESADKFGFTTPRSALLMGINYLLGKLENDEDIARGRRHAKKAAKILTDLGVKGGVTRKDINKQKKEKASGGMIKKNKMQKGGMVGASDMSAKKMASPEKKKKMPQYYMGGGMIKKNKMYAYGGRVAKYKG